MRHVCLVLFDGNEEDQRDMIDKHYDQLCQKMIILPVGKDIYSGDAAKYKENWLILHV